MKQRSFLICVGTRPEIIKMAPLYHALKELGHKMLLVHTGQHESIAQVLYDFFEMTPDIIIDLQRKSPTLGHLTAALMEGVEYAVDTLKPDVILVQGDTTSALVGAIVGYYHDIPVAHIEAGLRTFEREPFPEEKNRELIGRIAQWHFVPTVAAEQNLLNEGIAPRRIFEVGNTVIDAAQWTSKRIVNASFDMAICRPTALHDFLLSFPHQRLMLITAHRRENWGQPIRNIAIAVANIITDYPDTIAVWPVHPNPAVRADIDTALEDLVPAIRNRICLTQALSYPALISLLIRCEFTLTDSGGIQEEASAFSKPVLVARNSTERQELVAAGGARLVGTDVNTMVENIASLLNNKSEYHSMQIEISPFGDGHAASRIANLMSVPSDVAHFKDCVTLTHLQEAS